MKLAALFLVAGLAPAADTAALTPVAAWDAGSSVVVLFAEQSYCLPGWAAAGAVTETTVDIGCWAQVGGQILLSIDGGHAIILRASDFSSTSPDKRVSVPRHQHST